MSKLKADHAKVGLPDAQLVMLSGAAQRTDAAIVVPDHIKRGAARKDMTALLAKGLAREVRAKPGMPVVRRDEATGRSYALVITKLGLASIDVAMQRGNEPAVRTPAPASFSSGKRVAKQPRAVELGNESDLAHGSPECPAQGDAIAPTQAAESSSEPSPSPARRERPRAGSKLAEVIVLLSREDGAGIDELIDATGWLPHTTRAALTGLRKRGYAIVREQTGQGNSVYRIAGVACSQAA